MLKALPELPKGIITLLIGIVVIQISLWLLESTLRVSRVHKALVGILSSLAEVFMWIILIAAIFQALGLHQVAFAISGSVAIIGIGIAAGANSLVADIIAGLFLAKDRNFSVGQQIKIADIEGEIERIDIRKIRIRTKNGDLAIVPNAVFDKERWIAIEKK